jgi:hypothetical protein
MKSGQSGASSQRPFNTLFAQVLAQGATLANGTKATVFYADGLKKAGYLEPMAGLNIYFGYGAGRGTNIAPAWVGA